MNVSKAATIWIDYQGTLSKKIRFDPISPLLIGSASILLVLRLMKLPPMMSFPF
jgi:hypothetical protein